MAVFLISACAKKSNPAAPAPTNTVIITSTPNLAATQTAALWTKTSTPTITATFTATITPISGSMWQEEPLGALFPRQGHTSVVYNNEMWVIGGSNCSGNLNDVWYSSDGANWTQATTAAAFSARNSHASVVYNNEMWVIAGSNSNGYLNDAWWAQ